MKKTLLTLLLAPVLAIAAPQYTWESQGTSYTGQIDLGSSSTDPLSGSLTPSYGAINAQNAVQPPVVVVSSSSGGGGAAPTASGGTLTPSDACLVFKQGVGWVINDGSNTVASVGYICPDATIFAGFSGGRPFFAMSSDLDDASFNFTWSGFNYSTSAPTSPIDGGALTACKKYGNGFELPNIGHLKVMYVNKAIIDLAALTLAGGSSFRSVLYHSNQQSGAPWWNKQFNMGTGDITVNSSALNGSVRCIRQY